MVERYAHLASDHLSEAADRLGSVVAGYDLATVVEVPQHGGSLCEVCNRASSGCRVSN